MVPERPLGTHNEPVNTDRQFKKTLHGFAIIFKTPPVFLCRGKEYPEKR